MQSHIVKMHSVILFITVLCFIKTKGNEYQSEILWKRFKSVTEETSNEDFPSSNLSISVAVG